MKLTAKDIVASVVSGLLLVLLVVTTIQLTNAKTTASHLRNQLAASDTTVEVTKNLYAKKALEADDLKSLLDSSSTEVTSLKQLIKSDKEELLAVNVTVIRWKKAYEAALNASQTDVPTDPTTEPSTQPSIVRKRVDFDHDFGYIGVKGHTITDPPEAFVSIAQNRPLKLTMAIAQAKDHSWHAYVASSEDNVGVVIAVSAVNPLVLAPKWYEKIGVAGSVLGGPSLFVGLGLTYQLGRLELGPAVGASVGATSGLYGGATAIWHPFVRGN